MLKDDYDSLYDVLYEESIKVFVTEILRLIIFNELLHCLDLEVLFVFQSHTLIDSL